MVLRKSSGNMLALIIALLWPSIASGQTGSMYTSKTGTSPLQTPPDGFVFPVRCQLTADQSVPRPLQLCDTVGFHVIVNMTIATDVSFVPRGDLRAGTAYDPTDFGPCAEPTDSTYDQRCGVEALPLGEVAHERTGTCEPSCDPLTGICRCAAGTTGTCTCLLVKRFTIQPTKFANVGDMSVCFNATSRRVPPLPQERRCVFFDLLVPPHRLFATQSGSAVYALETTVGQPTSISVQAFDLNVQEKVSISIRSGSVELPNQQWAGDSYCPPSGRTVASLGVPCTAAVWQRDLLYTPRVSEAGMQYTIFFDAMDNGLSEVNVRNQSRFSQGSALAGSSCRDKYGLCDASAQSVGTAISPVPGLVVSVVQKAPDFMEGRPLESLYSQPGEQTNTPSMAGTPKDGSRLPNAYVNCPIVPFGVYAFKRNAAVQITLLPPKAEAGAVDPRNLGLVVSKQLLFRHFVGGPSPLFDLNSYYSHLQVSWTPPVGSEGREYKLCFKAEDTFSSSLLCLTLPVVRCMYCSLAEETLQTVASRFNTHWLQIWGANDADLALSLLGNFTASGVTPWNATRDPDHIEPGMVIRLGPVWKTRNDHTLGYAAQRFRTSVKHLMMMNPDLRHDNAQEDDIIPKGSEVCIVPEVCTAADPDGR